MIYLGQEKNSKSQQSSCSPDEKELFKCELINFNYVLKLSKILSRKIKVSGYIPDIIVAIGRGGFVPGRLVCDYLLLNDLTSMKIEHYKRAADMQTETKIKYPIPIDISGKKILIVDDITDTGDTLNLAVNYVKSLKSSEVRTAVLQHKTCSPFVPDYYARKIIKWRWIIYPWARYEDLAGFAEVIIRNKNPDISQIKSQLKSIYELDIKEKELQEILDDLSERGEIKRINGKYTSSLSHQK